MSDDVISDVSGMVLVARVKAQSGRRDDLLHAIRAVMEAGIELEPGCLGVTVHVSPEEPDIVFLHEHYASREAFAKHRELQQTNDRYIELGGNLRSLLAEPITDFEVYQPVFRVIRGLLPVTAAAR